MDIGLFAKRMAELRRCSGLNQTDFAERVGVTRIQVSRWETGASGIDEGRLKRILEEFGVSEEQFWDPDRPLAVGSGTIEVREGGQATRCPNCGAKGFDEGVRYCFMCAFPLYNFCTTSARHPNPPEAIYCGLCGERTFWSLDPGELESLEIPPDGHSIHKT